MGCEPVPAVKSNFVTKLESIQGAAGMNSYCSLLLIMVMNKWKMNGNYRDLVNWMVYADSLAFIFGLAAESIPAETENYSCVSSKLWFTADFIWAFKDAFKCMFLVYKMMKITGGRSISKRTIHILVWGVGCVSFALYIIFMCQAYDLQGDCSGQGKVINPTASLIVLYVFWLLVDSITTGVLVVFLFKHMTQMAVQSGDANVGISNALRKEVFRLIIGAGAMVVVCICAIAQKLDSCHTKLLYFPAAIFTYAQFVLVLSQLNTKADDNGHQTQITQGPADTANHTSHKQSAHGEEKDIENGPAKNQAVKRSTAF